MFLFGRTKTPQELVRTLKEILLQLERGDKKFEKVCIKYFWCIYLIFLFVFEDCRRCDKMFKWNKKYTIWNK